MPSSHAAATQPNTRAYPVRTPIPTGEDADPDGDLDDADNGSPGSPAGVARRAARGSPVSPRAGS